MNSNAWMPLIDLKVCIVQMFRMQWRGEVSAFLLDVLTTSKASPAFTILQEEVSMISSSLTQGLLIAENAG